MLLKICNSFTEHAVNNIKETSNVGLWM